MRLEISRRAIARVLGVTDVALIRWEEFGANLADPDHLRQTIDASGERSGKLRDLLSNPENRQAIRDQINKLRT
jgi:hypothetical protein